MYLAPNCLRLNLIGSATAATVPSPESWSALAYELPRDPAPMIKNRGSGFGMPEFGSSISGAIVRCSTKTAGQDEVLIYDVEVVVVSGFKEVSGNR